MFPTAVYDVKADRYAPHADYVDVRGFDFTGAVATMQVRDTRNGGTVRANPTVSVTVTMDGSMPVSRIAWTIAEGVMNVMPLDPINTAADVVLYYDIHLTPAGGTEFIPLRGKFTVVAGVYQ